MRLLVGCTVFLGMMVSLSACGGHTQQPGPMTGGAGGSGAGAGGDQATAAVDARMRVGHYRDADGTMSFKLDRSDERVAKLQYDGSSEVIQLTPRTGTFGRIDYVRAGHGVVLSVHPDGRVTAYHKDRPDGISVRRDDLRPDSPCCAEPKLKVKKDQPIEVKMRLGHYESSDGAMGFVLDRRDEKLAKLRYDGAREVVELTPRQGPSGRIDYVRKGAGVVLHVWTDGRVVIYHKDRPDGISVRRDADADPL